MRITLTIDDDVLAAARGLAASECKSVGKAISWLVRKALLQASQTGGMCNGVPLLPISPGAAPVNSELVRQLEQDLL
jgi:hypothetical protein